MGRMDYLKDLPVAVIDDEAVGKTCAADIGLTEREVRLYDVIPFVETSLHGLEKTGTLLSGVQRNRDGSERPGRVYPDLVATDIASAVKGVGRIMVACGSRGHKPMFRALIPHLEDGQVVNIFTDNFGTLLLRRLIRETGRTEKVIVGGWSSASCGTRVGSVNGFQFPRVGVKYRAIALRGAALPTKGTDAFLEAFQYLPCLDAITQGEGPAKANTVLDVNFANADPVIHVSATILGASTMKSWGVTFCDHDKATYSMYSRGLSPSICEVQYQFYNEELTLAGAIGVDAPAYKHEMFFSRHSMLTQEYMGLSENGSDNVVFPLDQPSNEGNTGPNSTNHRYLIEDVPIDCKTRHDLGVQYGVSTPIIDAMIALAGVMYKKSFFETSRYTLACLGIDDMLKQELLAYLNEDVYNR